MWVLSDQTDERPLQLAHMAALGRCFVPCKVSMWSWSLRSEAFLHALESGANIGAVLLLTLKTGYQGIQKENGLKNHSIFLLESIAALVLGGLFCIASIIKGLAAAIIHPAVVYKPYTAIYSPSEN